MLRFPDPARLELDRAVQDLLDRVGEVLRTQGRLRDLLHAVLAVFHATGDLAGFLQMAGWPAPHPATSGNRSWRPSATSTPSSRTSVPPSLTCYTTTRHNQGAAPG
ncbi:hypothetical protein ACWGKQ_35790 [Streptomyces sp. NPDC054770]